MRLEISCQDRLGIAQDVLELLKAHEIDLRGIEINEAGKIYLSFPTIEFTEVEKACLSKESRGGFGSTD